MVISFSNYYSDFYGKQRIKLKISLLSRPWAPAYFLKQGEIPAYFIDNNFYSIH